METQAVQIGEEILEEYSKEWMIVVSDNGFVHMGRPKRIDCPLLGTVLRIFDSYTVRRYGTTQGLGQLCQQGKQSRTELDYDGVTDVPIGKILHINMIKTTALDTYGFIK